MKNKKILTITIIATIILILGLTTFISIRHFSENVKISINGEKNIKLDVFSEYQELGATAKLCHLKECEDVTNNIKINTNLDTSKIGNYDVEYQIVLNNKTYLKKRKVSVVDNVKPEIVLTDGDKITLCPLTEYKESGYTATDNYDGDISNKVEVEKQKTKYIYKVSDSSGNKTKATRIIEYKDTKKPELKLKGSNSITLPLNSNYIEYGASASDNCSEVPSNEIKITSNIDVTKEGTYNVNYSVSDNAGNIATLNRTVKIQAPVTFNTTDKNSFIENLEKYIKEKNYKVSIGYINLKTGYQYLYKPETIYYGASLVKTVDALYIYEKLNFDEMTRKNVEKAISVSDNTAHRNLVDQIGIENLRAYGRNLGAKNFLTRSNSDYFGNTTVYDQIAIWKYLYNFINTNSKGNELKQYFINDYYSFMQFEGIPTTMHKYGWYGDYYHDVGIVYSNNPYLLVILTKHGAGNYRTITADLSKKIYELNKID